MDTCGTANSTYFLDFALLYKCYWDTNFFFQNRNILSILHSFVFKITLDSKEPLNSHVYTHAVL